VPPIRLTDDQFHTLMGESDPFRLAILGHSAIEADVDAAIAEAFDGNVPVELTRPWRIKIALVVALGVLPARYRPLFDQLAQLRNKFAHGEIHTLTRGHANTLLDAIRPIVTRLEEKRPEEARSTLQKAEPILSLRFALSLARDLFELSATFARERREKERQAVIAQRFARRENSALLLALADIKLDDEQDDVPPSSQARQT
jgi:hypothetical protein